MTVVRKVSFSITPDVYEEIERLAMQDDVGVTDWIRNVAVRTVRNSAAIRPVVAPGATVD